MDMIIGLPFVMVKYRYTLHTILVFEEIRELFQHIIGFQILIFFRQSYDYDTGFYTSSCTAAPLEITLIFFCQLLSEAIITSPVNTI